MCLDLCRQRSDATGCEIIFDKWIGRGCYVHTKPVAKVSGILMTSANFGQNETNDFGSLNTIYLAFHFIFGGILAE